MSYSVFCKYAAETALSIKAQRLMENPSDFGIDDELRDPISLGDAWRYKTQVNEYFNSLAATKLQQALRDRAAVNIGVAPKAKASGIVPMGYAKLSAGKPRVVYELGAHRLAEDKIVPMISGPTIDSPPDESLELSLRAYDELQPPASEIISGMSAEEERLLRNRAISYSGQLASQLARRSAPSAHGEIGTAVNLGLRTLALKIDEREKQRRRRTGGAVFAEPVPIQYQMALAQQNAQEGQSGRPRVKS